VFSVFSVVEMNYGGVDVVVEMAYGMMDLFLCMMLVPFVLLMVLPLVFLWSYRPRLMHTWWQFRLQTLLLAFVVVWSSLAAFGMWGIVVAAILLLIAVYVRSVESTVHAHVLVCLLMMCGTWLLLPAVNAPRGSHSLAMCRHQIIQLCWALHQYHSDFGCSPPAYVSGPDGEPMHSWRVLLLPYIEEEPLYDQYDFDEPWDGPNNSKLAASMPRLFVCRSANPARTGTSKTSYVAVVGPKTALPGNKSGTLTDIADGSYRTIAIVELANSDIDWMEPRDITLDELCSRINSELGTSVFATHVQENGYFHHDQPVFHVGFVDGSVRLLPADISPESFASLLTRDGGEEIDDIDSLLSLPPKKLRCSRIIALIVLALSYAILLFRPRSKTDA